eukprot:988235-Pleurochrysis_carterae.AAC.1
MGIRWGSEAKGDGGHGKGRAKEKEAADCCRVSMSLTEHHFKREELERGWWRWVEMGGGRETRMRNEVCVVNSPEWVACLVSASM